MFGCFTIHFSVFYFDVLIGNRRNKSNKHASAVSEVDKVVIFCGVDSVSGM